MPDTKRLRGDGVILVAICPRCKQKVEFIGRPMVRCYATGEVYEPESIIWVPESEIETNTGYCAENIRGNDIKQDFMPNAHPPQADSDFS